ncbi:MAG TPA: hypothetical protein VNA25_01360 [Phycisphaerae bacterium]|nr:hypothetical protein [Phycisphaerae bacterium]
MGIDPVRSALTTKYVQTLLRIKARQLSRRPEFCKTDPADIEHDLIAQVLKQADDYNPVRSAPQTFITRVIETAVAMLVRDRRRIKRAAGYRAISLEGTVLEGDGRETALSELIRESDLRRRCGGAPTDAAFDLRFDVQEALTRLPKDLRRIAMRLMRATEAGIARELGISRRQVRKSVEAIREHFERAGLRESDLSGQPAHGRHR